MSSLHLLLLLLSLFAFSIAFDKNLLKKAKFDVSHKHPISRRVLRFERSVDQFDSNRIDENSSFMLPFDFPALEPHTLETKDSSSSSQFVTQKDLFTLLTPFNEQDVEETNF
ncbi:hypothetical protein PMAYCL1PPCAC_06954 [Pristionchus mayeri]|uniref:Uncharacterized protein n=1 Tax=Pristionchus mayeri TaxID=1317129 RepID=A0AAN4ZB66_9BILA|nr:hypothetical protein PMAYCL1PPCAC_06954 [Pristionchus mayeri]